MQAKGRLQCWNADGQGLGCREGCAGKGQAANSGAAKADGQSLKPGKQQA